MARKLYKKGLLSKPTYRSIVGNGVPDFDWKEAHVTPIVRKRNMKHRNKMKTAAAAIKEIGLSVDWGKPGTDAPTVEAYKAVREMLDLEKYTDEEKIVITSDKDVAPKWIVTDGELYSYAPEIISEIPCGFYAPQVTNNGVFLKKMSIKLDEAYVLEGSQNEELLKDVDLFLSKADLYRKNGFAHKRGYLLHGPPGGGKSSMSFQIAEEIVKRGGITIVPEANSLVPAFIMVEQLKKIEPDKIVCIMLEDIDIMCNDERESYLLNILDGAMQTDGALFIATTNYPERLPPRIINRPRRFDKILQVGYPDESVRRQYFSRKLKDATPEEIQKYVDLTHKMGYAALAEMIISTKCIGISAEDASLNLAEINKLKVTSEDYESARRKMGFTDY